MLQSNQTGSDIQPEVSNNRSHSKWRKIAGNTLYTAYTAVEIFGLYRAFTDGDVSQKAAAVTGALVWLCLATPTVISANGIGNSRATTFSEAPNTLNDQLLASPVEAASDVVTSYPIGDNSV